MLSRSFCEVDFYSSMMLKFCHCFSDAQVNELLKIHNWGLFVVFSLILSAVCLFITISLAIGCCYQHKQMKGFWPCCGRSSIKPRKKCSQKNGKYTSHYTRVVNFDHSSQYSYLGIQTLLTLSLYLASFFEMIHLFKFWVMHDLDPSQNSLQFFKHSTS